MIFIAIAGIAALLAVIVLQSRSQAAERDAWTKERSELLNRILRPEQLPTMPVPEWPVLEEDPLDPEGLVGSIEYDDDYGKDEF